MISTTPGRHRPERAAARLAGGRHAAADDQPTLDPNLVRWAASRTRVATDTIVARRARRALDQLAGAR
jgi:hypothetical protein